MLNMQKLKAPEGLTVAAFKALIAEWPETDPHTGEPAEVWVSNGRVSNVVTEVWPLNAVDLLLETDH